MSEYGCALIALIYLFADAKESGLEKAIERAGPAPLGAVEWLARVPSSFKKFSF